MTSEIGRGQGLARRAARRRGWRRAAPRARSRRPTCGRPARAGRRGRPPWPARSSVATISGSGGRGPGRSGGRHVDAGVGEETVGQGEDLLGHAVADVELGVEHARRASRAPRPRRPSGTGRRAPSTGPGRPAPSSTGCGRSAGRACATPWPRRPGPRPPRGGRSAGAGRRARRRPRRSARRRPPSTPRRRPAGRPARRSARCSASVEHAVGGGGQHAPRLVSSRRTSAGAVTAGHARSSDAAQVGARAHARWPPRRTA